MKTRGHVLFVALILEMQRSLIVAIT